MPVTGVDVGTNRIVAATINSDGDYIFKSERDAFYRIVPKSDVNKNAIKMSLEKRGSNFIMEDDNFCVVGEDAIQIALDRNDASMRPMRKGVISPKDKANMPIIKLLIESLVGKGDGSKLVYSVPAAPIEEDFDIEYHTTILSMFFEELGYNPTPINEAFAIGLNELIDTGVTGIAISFGAGMSNIAVIAQGDPVITFSTTRSGDYIDKQVGTALDMSPSLVQLEKEAGIDLYNPSSKIVEAVAVYYKAVINYTVKNIEYELKNRKGKLPVFREKVPVILSGGLSWAKGFDTMFGDALRAADLPFDLGEIRVVENPDNCVAAGCLLAAQL
jgi:hypothetical protein